MCLVVFFARFIAVGRPFFSPPLNAARVICIRLDGRVEGQWWDRVLVLAFSDIVTANDFRHVYSGISAGQDKNVTSRYLTVPMHINELSNSTGVKGRIVVDRSR